MGYTNQIRILERKLEQLSRIKIEKENTSKVLQLKAELNKMRRLEWEEKFETVKIEEER